MLVFNLTERYIFLHCVDQVACMGKMAARIPEDTLPVPLALPPPKKKRPMVDLLSLVNSMPSN